MALSMDDILDDFFFVGLDAATRVFAPASLSLARGAGDSPRHLPPDIRDAVARLRVGDVVLVATPGVVFEAFRDATGSPFDHAAIIVRGGTGAAALHVGPPRVRLLPADKLLAPERKPLVLRPRLTAAQRGAVARAAKQLVGARYSGARTTGLMLRLFLSKGGDVQWLMALPPPPPLAREPPPTRRSKTDETDDSSSTTDGVVVSAIPPPPGSRAAQARAKALGAATGAEQHVARNGSLPRAVAAAVVEPRWICSDAVMSLLAGHSPAIRAAVDDARPPLDLLRHGSASTADFVSLHRARPDLLRRVPLRGLEPRGGFRYSHLRRPGDRVPRRLGSLSVAGPLGERRRARREARAAARAAAVVEEAQRSGRVPLPPGKRGRPLPDRPRVAARAGDTRPGAAPASPPRTGDAGAAQLRKPPMLVEDATAAAVQRAAQYLAVLWRMLSAPGDAATAGISDLRGATLRGVSLFAYVSMLSVLVGRGRAVWWALRSLALAVARRAVAAAIADLTAAATHSGGTGGAMVAASRL